MLMHSIREKAQVNYTLGNGISAKIFSRLIEILYIHIYFKNQTFILTVESLTSFP